MKTIRQFSTRLWQITFLFVSVTLGAAAHAKNGPVTCSIQTFTGHYLTAVGGGGRITDVIHSDANWVKGWERFTLVDSGDGSSFIRYGILTQNGRFLTAVSGGGRINDVIHSDAIRLQAWEKFTFIPLGGDYYAIQTINGRYLTAVDGGGRITDVIHSDATKIGAWERFRLNCGI